MKRRNNVRGNDHTAPADLPERAAGNTFPVPGKYIVMKPVLLIGLLAVAINAVSLTQYGQTAETKIPSGFNSSANARL